jgi:CcmD family protein
MHNAMMKRLLPAIGVVGVVVIAFLGSTVAEAGQQPEPKQQEEFVPIDELPPQDQLPAAPLLVTAYSFVVLALFAYLISVARRLGVVQRELDRLQSDARRGRT